MATRDLTPQQHARLDLLPREPGGKKVTVVGWDDLLAGPVLRTGQGELRVLTTGGVIERRA